MSMAVLVWALVLQNWVEHSLLSELSVFLGKSFIQQSATRFSIVSLRKPKRVINFDFGGGRGEGLERLILELGFPRWKGAKGQRKLSKKDPNG